MATPGSSSSSDSASPTESVTSYCWSHPRKESLIKNICSVYSPGSSGATKSSLDCARCCSVTRLMDMSVLRSTSPTTSHQPSVLLLG